MSNPYAPPAASLSAEDESRDLIKKRVARPATALIIMALLAGQ